jgi:hypothetical protein
LSASPVGFVVVPSKVTPRSVAIRWSAGSVVPFDGM